MFDYSNLKKEAISLRKKGSTYSEILKKIKVSKSTLSLWLRSVGLSKKQNQKITAKKLASAKRGGIARKIQADKRREDIYKKSESEIGVISKRELWLLGIALYWGEGSKEKVHHPGSGVEFTNSDPYMLKLFLLWLDKIFGYKNSDMTIEIYIHEIYLHRINKIKTYWSEILNIPKENFVKVYLKRHAIKTSRKNVGNMYNGNLRIRVKASSESLRRITGWVRGMYKNKYCGIV